jgi:S1-C subfamily serine protease
MPARLMPPRSTPLRLKMLAASVLLLLPLTSFIPAAPAQERRVPASPNEVRLSYAPVVQRAAPAVVNVYAARTVTNQNPMLTDPFFRRFFELPGMPAEQVQRSLGSGVLVDPAGLVVTNNHVIEGADQVKVSLADKREFEAELVLKDQRSDLAVLRIKDARERFPAIEFSDSDALQVGDIVLAIGNPFAVGQTVTHGIVSAVARTQVGITDYQFFIQTDAAINPGNSGGALVDLSGKLVGINTAIFSRSGGSQGIGFAIPANMVRVVVASAKTGRHRGQAALARRAIAGGHARDSGRPRAQAADRRAGGERDGGNCCRAGGTAYRRSDRVDRRAAGRRPQCLRLSLRDQVAGGHRQARPHARGSRAVRVCCARNRP